MFNKLHRVLKSRLASTMLAAVLFAGLTAPFIMLQSMHASAGTAPLPCTQGNNNGCTELSSTPPEDLQPVPPNIVLMLDDSGSMNWDFMPDWAFLADKTNNGARDSAINFVYYNPATVYAPPPKADSTVTVPDLYPASPGLTGAYKDGFQNLALQDIRTFTGGVAPNTFPYYTSLPTTDFNEYGAPVSQCPNGYIPDPSNPAQCISNNQYPTPVAQNTTYSCPSGGSVVTYQSQKQCRTTIYNGELPVTYTYYVATATTACPSGTTYNSATKLCDYPPNLTVKPPTLQCPSGGSKSSDNMRCESRISINAFTYVTGVSPSGPFTARYVAGTTDCNRLYNASQKAACVNEGDTSGVAAPATNAAGNPLTAGQNVANWFSYYRSRLLLSKSGLMAAFSTVSPSYRFGFSSINGNGTPAIPATPAAYPFDDSMASGTGGKSSNTLAVVQPFGDGSTGTQKALFWNWLVRETAQNETPLRKALSAVGQYYQTAQPWTTMPGDPGYTTGSTTQFTCRASFAILTTDGFWNGDAPAVGAGAANADGPVQTVPNGSITQYKAVPPFSGGAAAGGEPSLADVATYYWETDLNPSLSNEVSAGISDPASWQHMTTYTIGLGVTPSGILPATGSPPVGPTFPQILGWANGGAPITGFSWPQPGSGILQNIADLAHAALNGHGDFFNVSNPADLANAFSKTLADIGARTTGPTPAGVNTSVLSIGASSFRSGYSTGDWSGTFDEVTLNADGTVNQQLWGGQGANGKLNADYHSPTSFINRKVFTGSNKTGTFTGSVFNAANAGNLDTAEIAGLEAPPLAGGSDTLANRIDYLLGDNTNEGTLYRGRTNILGAIIHSEPVYVAGATGNYIDSWPTFGSFTPPEAATGAQTYAAFVSAQSTRVPQVYVGANDGMLHAFNAPVPQCSTTVDSSGNCAAAYTFPAGSNEGQEAWAFVPRAVYANLGNLTNKSNFQFLPTVDATPVPRDVFFNSQWHTILAGGVGLGGRGVYGLDITNPATFSQTSVLWEFDSDLPVASTCVTNDGSTCKGTDLGYTVAQPNVARLSNGEWVVLVPNGYFPDCGTPDYPTATQAACQAIAAQAPKDAAGKPYSALFVLDARTGKLIAELKTPSISGVTSFGLAKPVVGDYNNDQVDDVAFAGDVQGNLWRFDLSSTTPADWAVTLVYQGVTDANGNQGVQPITTMPRLFPDPTTNRFLVLFGTGKYLGVSDNSNDVVQSIIAVRDVVGTTYNQADLTQQFLHETVVPNGQPNAGASLRCITGSSSNDCTTAINTIPSTAGGWYVNLTTTTSDNIRNNAGERIVVNPAAIFASNTVIFESLITGSLNSDACNPSTQGSLLAFNAITGGSGGVSSLGGLQIVGGRISNARTSGSLPVVSALGGGKVYVPGANLAPADSPIAIDAPIWRRRSWRVLLNDQ